MRKRIPRHVWLLSALVVIWCVALPFLWASTIAKMANIAYLSTLALYVPELATGSLVLVSFAQLIRSSKVAAAGLVATAVANLGLKFTIGSPTSGTWIVSSLLLLALAICFYRLAIAVPPHSGHEHASD